LKETLGLTFGSKQEFANNYQVAFAIDCEAVSNSNEARLSEHTSLPGGVSLIPGSGCHSSPSARMRLLKGGHDPPEPEIDMNAL
jgi:hypothetical protein